MEKDVNIKKDVNKNLIGFARLDPEKRKEMSAKGGRAVPNDRRSFYQDRQLAREAQKKALEVRIKKHTK